eukprot:9503359-Prorocentrum_lima.AAC.1
MCIRDSPPPPGGLKSIPGAIRVGVRSERSKRRRSAHARILGLTPLKDDLGKARFRRLLLGEDTCL